MMLKFSLSNSSNVTEICITTQFFPHLLVDVPISPVPRHISEVLVQAIAVADFCANHAAEIDCHGKYPRQEFERLAETGLLTAPLQPALGGVGL